MSPYPGTVPALVSLCEAIVLNGLDRLLTRRALRDYDLADGFLLVYQVLSTAVSLPLAVVELVRVGDPDEASDSMIWWVIPLSVGLWAIYSVSAFRSARLLELSVSSTIGRLRIVLTAVLGVVFFGETLGPVAVCGIVLLLLAAVPLIRMPTARISPRGVLLALVSTGAITLALLADKLLTRVLPPSCIVAMGFLGTSLIALILNRRRSWAGLRPIIVPAAIAGVAGTLGYVALLRALAGGAASVILPIYQASGILYVVAGIVLLGERADRGRKLTAAMIATAGAWCLLGSG